ncbi:hypothetical protein PO883_11745 [Massilia sp. DJPM01]|uniref:hypothetical protein n=1 Tax=Massilia sp. DJPM01 TaxID=3024404 RepID=UPI00259D77BC|nr:hypothetical protein [Massilia sp. DJPM01]MDM5177864.1 hypothetical protein [Massilia sp. DJPM01]
MANKIRIAIYAVLMACVVYVVSYLYAQHAPDWYPSHRANEQHFVAFWGSGYLFKGKARMSITGLGLTGDALNFLRQNR